MRFTRRGERISLVNEFIGKLSSEDQKQALGIVSNLHQIFEDLRKQGILRLTLRDGWERTKFLNIMKTSDKLNDVYNMLFHIFEERGRSKKFAEHNKDYGFSEDRLAYLFLSEIISTFIRTTEQFRNVFLFTLKSRKGFTPRTTLGRLLRELKKMCPRSKAIVEKIDVDLRNALAHGMFWMEGIVLNYYEDMRMKEQKSIRIDYLWGKVREHSKFAQCLINFVADWYTAT